MLDRIPFVYQVIGLMVLAYLMGSISFGYLAGRLKGVDLRTQGSKNIGATNAGRVLGRKYFFMVFLLDLLKGFFPTMLAGQILFLGKVSPHIACLLWLMVAFAAIAGHNWPCWLKFKGGKGVSTSLGVVLAIYPYYTYPGLIALAVWIILVKISGYVSLGSIIGAATFALSYFILIFCVPGWTFRDQWPMVVFAAAMSALLILRHGANIRRLCSGTESKFKLEDRA
jgi:glycerol-3-phosphate acyltransferase PlsY